MFQFPVSVLVRPVSLDGSARLVTVPTRSVGDVELTAVVSVFVRPAMSVRLPVGLLALIGSVEVSVLTGSLLLVRPDVSPSSGVPVVRLVRLPVEGSGKVGTVPAGRNAGDRVARVGTGRYNISERAAIAAADHICDQAVRADNAGQWVLTEQIAGQAAGSRDAKARHGIRDG